jgi:hypothetical protein
MVLAVVLCAIPAPAVAQQAASTAPVSDALRAVARRYARNLVAAADDMPVAKFTFKPTPAQMSFADIVLHLADGNHFLCGGVTGAQPPAEPAVAKADSADPRGLVDRMRRSFEFCNTSLAKLDDSNLTGQVPWFGGPNSKISRASAVLALPEDWADHYSQMAIYLRLNGILPPTARPRPTR